MKIYIDPGHGGNDSGAVGNGLLEKELNLDISLRQKELFEALGHEVKMSRIIDKRVELSTRAEEANAWGADIFISNHVNSGGGVGVEVWHSIYGGKGKDYAAKVVENLSKIFKSRGLKCKEGRNGDYLYVIRFTKMPAILNEFGFIDSVEDTDKLKKQEVRQKCAEAVVLGVAGKLPSKKESTAVSKKSYSLGERILFYKMPMISGEDVKILQEKLNKLGFNVGVVDGIFGKKTDFQVRNYQKSKGLVVDGIVGKNTWNKLLG